MLNYETILSSYDDRLTLLQWLKKVEAALANASFENFEVVSLGDATYKFKATFADGSEIESNPIRIGERISSAYIGAGNTLHLVTESGDDIDAGSVLNGLSDLTITGTLTANKVEQAVPNWEATFAPNLSAADVSAGLTLTPIYNRLCVINGILYVVMVNKVENPTAATITRDPSVEAIGVNIPPEIGVKIIDVDGFNLTFGGGGEIDLNFGGGAVQEGVGYPNVRLIVSHANQNKITLRNGMQNSLNIGAGKNVVIFSRTFLTLI